MSVIFSKACVNLAGTSLVQVLHQVGGGGVLSYMGYLGVCYRIGCGF